MEIKLNAFYARRLVVFITLAAALGVHAGNSDGGGGNSVVCRNDQGGITSAETLDLYEGRVERTLQYAASGENFDSTANEMLKKLGSGRDENFTNYLLSVKKFIKAINSKLPDETGLNTINDSYHEKVAAILPKNCKIEQTVNYTKDNLILIDGEIWKSLDELNKAALIVHEALYSALRTYGAATDSVRVRQMVAMAFAGIYPEPYKQGVPRNALECHTVTQDNSNPLSGSHFWAYNDHHGELMFQFDYISGGLILTKTTVSIDKIPSSDLLLDDADYWEYFELGLESVYEKNSPLTVFLGPHNDYQNHVQYFSKKIGKDKNSLMQFVCTK